MSPGVDPPDRARGRGKPAPNDPTIADIYNGFFLDSGRRRGKDRGHQDRSADQLQDTASHPAFGGDLDYDQPEEEQASIVRAYTWTGGRTTSDRALEIETLVSLDESGWRVDVPVQAEYQQIGQLCRQPRSVAEIAALLSLPLGVAKVLLGDMAGLGLIVVHETASADQSGPDLALMERVLSGLRRL